jgi:hypothetical protein
VLVVVGNSFSLTHMSHAVRTPSSASANNSAVIRKDFLIINLGKVYLPSSYVCRMTRNLALCGVRSVRGHHSSNLPNGGDRRETSRTVGPITENWVLATVPDIHEWSLA